MLARSGATAMRPRELTTGQAKGGRRPGRDPRLTEMREEIRREGWKRRVSDSTLLAAQLAREIARHLENGDLTGKEVILAYSIVTEKIQFWRDLAGHQSPLAKLRSLDPDQLAQDHERLAAMHRELARRRAEIKPVEVEVMENEKETTEDP